MATNNYFSYSGTQYAAANAAYQQHQQTQQAYAVPGTTTGATTAASYTPQRNAYDAAYQTSTAPMTYTAPAAVGVTYDSTKTFYQQATPTAAAAAATSGQGASAVTVGSTPEFQNWQQANYNARQTNAAVVAAAAAANKVTFCASYNPVPTTRQLTVPPISPKVQTTNAASAFAGSQFTSQSTTAAPNYNYSNSTVSKAATVGTIGQPAKKIATPYQQKAPSSAGAVTSNNAGAYNANNATYGTAYGSPGVNSAMYNVANHAVRPKANHAMGHNAASGSNSYQNPYDAALISAAATMYMNQNPRAAAKGGSNFKPRPGLGSNAKFKNYRPPKPQQLHYCDACKISCAGPSAYHDHLQGQKHKKKVTKAKPEPPKKGTPGGNLPVFTCELCDIECTAADAYAAHLRGAKHTKVVKLHTKLGKPIPQPDPKAAAAIAALSAQEEAAKVQPNNVTSSALPANANAPVVRSVAPRINFVAAGTSSTAATSTISKSLEKSDESSVLEDSKTESELSLIDDRPAVGSEYIEEEKDASGKLISFNCKLCECKFSDPNAKEMHMKGRKHRLQFKKKVDPKLKVEMKPNNFKQKRNEKWKKQAEKKDLKRKDMRFDDEFKDYFDWCRKPGAPLPAVPGLLPQGVRHPMMRAAPRPLLLGPGGRLPIPPQSPQPPMFMLNAPPIPAFRKMETFEDRHVLTRHKAIFPSGFELKNIQRAVDQIERALKFVSDQMLTAAEEELLISQKEDGTESGVDKSNSLENAGGGDGVGENDKDDDAKSDKERSQGGAVRELTGVLRVGIIAKGLILTGDTEINLVMLCSGKPTMTLLSKVVSLLPDQLKEVSKETEFSVTAKPADAAIVINTCPKEENEKMLTVVITLTSTVIREEIMAVSENNVPKEEANNDVTPAGDGCKVSKEISPDPPDVLSKTKCLEALAALRHAKWFQAKASTHQSSFVILRILRDVCRRVPAWASFNSWALELLCEKVLSSSNMMLSPGDALRRVFECISAGILLPDGPGLLDPCEKDPVDATACLTAQQREDITTYAQYALRLIAFRQIHKVLGMEQLPPAPKFRGKQTTRKRRRENSAGGRNEGVDGKKDKKDGDDEPENDQNIGEDVNGQEREEPEKMETDKPASTK